MSSRQAKARVNGRLLQGAKQTPARPRPMLMDSQGSMGNWGAEAKLYLVSAGSGAVAADSLVSSLGESDQSSSCLLLAVGDAFAMALVEVPADNCCSSPSPPLFVAVSSNLFQISPSTHSPPSPIRPGTLPESVSHLCRDRISI